MRKTVNARIALVMRPPCLNSNLAGRKGTSGERVGVVIRCQYEIAQFVPRALDGVHERCQAYSSIVPGALQEM